MDFKETKTYVNLASSFAGECQAGMRYQFVAQQAMQDGYDALSTLIKGLAKNETAHAKVFFDYIAEKAGEPIDNIEITAGYPFKKGTLTEGLMFSMQSELNEAENVYPSFMKDAKDEGFKDIANTYKLIIEVEKQHKMTFEYLLCAMKKGTLYKGSKPILWKCNNCGHTAVLKQAWNICPLCNEEQGHVEINLPTKEEK